jgi:hypothetical protein
VLSGTASEKGQEAGVTRSLIEQVLQAAGPDTISKLLADALYADGPRLSWLKYSKGIDAFVPLPADRLLYQDVQGLADAQLIEWTHHRYVRTVQGHKQIREVELTAAGELTSWDGFTEAAATSEMPDATLWACLIRDVTTPKMAQEPPIAKVRTRRWQNGFAALQAYRPRWHIEDDTYRELKEGWGLEKQRWGRDVAAALERITLTCLAFIQYCTSLSLASGAVTGCCGHSAAASSPAAGTGQCSRRALPGWLLWRLCSGRITEPAWLPCPGESPA